MRLALVGVGLIGGSIGLAARGRAGAHVVGYDPDERALARALELGAIDEAAADLAAAMAEADAAFVAAPVGRLPEIVGQTLAAAGPDCVVSDVGSTKRPVAHAIDDPRFIGGHPLAGAESGGVEHARADLFAGAAWYLTPSANASPALLARLRSTIVSLGGEPLEIEPDAHDRLMAYLSHLPHVLANVLVSAAAHALGDERRVSVPSFRDATRVAGANTAIWIDIYLSNRDALTEALDDALERLTQVRSMLADEDACRLRAWNERVRAERERPT